MNKEDILAISRKENGNKDLPEMEMALRAGSIAARVGAGMCCLISAMFAWATGTMLISTWIIFFGILGTHYLVRTKKTRRKTDLAITVLYFTMCALCFTFFALRLIEVKT